MNSSNIENISSGGTLYKNLNGRPLFHPELLHYNIVDKDEETIQSCVDEIIFEVDMLKRMFLKLQDNIESLPSYRFVRPALMEAAAYYCAIANLILDEENEGNFNEYCIEMSDKKVLVNDVIKSMINEIYINRD